MSKQTYKNSEVVNWIKYPLRMDENSAQWVKKTTRRTNMPKGKGTYGSKVGRPPKKKKKTTRKKKKKRY